ncbi:MULTISPECIES: hypothetical protein [unclassified Okeania]|uniref:hypothetical protein n=1 Tax=unclassified Okeania TaxID=2634635 RepID=UPI0013BA05F7|nr:MULTISPECIES: hypothetical protein [unclassified Okeania]NES79460.1 hypothetical protein [Okeania sp. SIO1H4]NET23109.1 hypothetical protein [Okeania sp. SIO1H5]NET96616.1 hypothetical protein [Okeania sp. SIO1H2]
MLCLGWNDFSPLFSDNSINILGICVFYFDAQENLSYLKPDRQLLSQEMIEKQTQEAINLVLGGVLLYSENSGKV